MEPTLSQTYCTYHGLASHSATRGSQSYAPSHLCVDTHVSFLLRSPISWTCFLYRFLSAKFFSPSFLVAGCLSPVPFTILFLPLKGLGLKGHGVKGVLGMNTFPTDPLGRAEPWGYEEASLSLGLKWLLFSDTHPKAEKHPSVTPKESPLCDHLSQTIDVQTSELY